MTSTPWEGYSSSIQLRPYQQRAMASFQAAVEQPRKRFFYLVAPPGAGKTLLGLLMSEILELPCLSLSPNAAIQAQWLARLQQHWVCLDSALEAFEPHPRCSDRPAKDPQALVSLTYQRIAVRGREGSAHPNVLALYQALREAGVQCVVLDECHHLSSEWGRAVEALCQALAVPFVVGQVLISRRDDGTVRVKWQGVDAEQSERLSAALAELLGPVINQRYLLAEELYAVGSQSIWSRLAGERRTTERVFPVPRMFSRKNNAERFCDTWRALRNQQVKLHHSQSDEGREVAQRSLHGRALEGETAIRTVWS